MGYQGSRCRNRDCQAEPRSHSVNETRSRNRSLRLSRRSRRPRPRGPFKPATESGNLKGDPGRDTEAATRMMPPVTVTFVARLSEPGRGSKRPGHSIMALMMISPTQFPARESSRTRNDSESAEGGAPSRSYRDRDGGRPPP
jgi:hypothetical protein